MIIRPLPTAVLLQAVDDLLTDSTVFLGKVYQLAAPADALTEGSVRILIEANGAMESPLQQRWEVQLDVTLDSSSVDLCQTEGAKAVALIGETGEQDKGDNLLVGNKYWRVNTVTLQSTVDPRVEREKGKRFFKYRLRFMVIMEGK